MGAYVITGGKPLAGTISISGNKNAALPCLAATLLTDERIVLRNIPAIEDVKIMLELLKSLGSSVEYIDTNTVAVASTLSYCRNIDEIPRHLVDAIRASILLSGPLVARRKKVLLPPPGGDVIGLRRLDTHFAGLEALGCTCKITSSGMLEITEKKLQGTRIFLEEASVTATENLVMAASLSSGTTVLVNAACEPHVQDVCTMLVAMGANISGIGSNVLTIVGTDSLSGCDFTIGSDYMEVGSFIGLAAATKGEILLENVNLEHVSVLKRGFQKVGIECVETGSSSLLVPALQARRVKKALDGGTIKLDDAPWPGFPADLLSIITVVATQMHGTVLIHEKMYETRMFFIDWLVRMGADIILCDPHRAVVNGPSRLKNAVVTSPDVRAGMALVIAALCSQGVSTIQNIYQIERGYEQLAKKLLGVGASIERIE